MGGNVLTQDKSLIEGCPLVDGTEGADGCDGDPEKREFPDSIRGISHDGGRLAAEVSVNLWAEDVLDVSRALVDSADGSDVTSLDGPDQGFDEMGVLKDLLW